MFSALPSTQGSKRDAKMAKGSQKQAKWSQGGPKGTPKRSHEGPEGTPEEKNRRQVDQIRTPKLQNWNPKGPSNGKNEKVAYTETPKVEKLKHHKK